MKQRVYTIEVKVPGRLAVVGKALLLTVALGGLVALALPVTFTSGSQLRAADLNQNFGDLDARLGAIEFDGGAASQIVTRARVPRPFTFAADGGVTLVVGSGAGAAFPSIQAAWAFLETRVIRVPVTVHLQDGTYTLPDAGFDLNHPDGMHIRIVGNEAAPNNVNINSTGDGMRVGNGGRLAGISGVRITGGGAANSYGVLVQEGASTRVGPAVNISAFEYGVWLRQRATVNADGLDVTGMGLSVGACIYVHGSHFEGSALSLGGCSVGVQALSNATVTIAGATVQSVYGGFWAGQRSYMNVGGVTGAPTNAGFRSSEASLMFVGGPASFTRSPLTNVLGNGNALILE